MSADNTVVILVTRRRDGRVGQEYRVAHCQAIENLWFSPDYPSEARPEVNREWLRSLCGEVDFLHSAEEALRQARRSSTQIISAGHLRAHSTWFALRYSVVR